MKFLVLFLAITTSALAARTITKERKLYVGKDSTEATLTFTHYVDKISETKPSRSEAKEHIEAQLNHMFGPMGEAATPAVPSGHHELSGLKIESLGENLYRIHYDYEGTIVLKNGPDTKYEFVLPNNPETIYASGMRGRSNPCTDEHYQSEGDFWYFWNPEKPGCKLKEGEDFTTVAGKIKRIKNSKESYPEYERLVHKGEISIHILMGMDHPEEGRDPHSSRDENAFNFRDIHETLEGMGFQSSQWKMAQIKEIFPRASARSAPHVEDLTKTLERDGKEITLRIRMFFAPSGIDENSTAFHYFFKDALSNASVMIYDGHSGLGGHLDLPTIESVEGFRLQPNRSRYQIYFFNSCSSYTYYNSMFFGRKISTSDPEGTKNLDIFTNGLATYFHVMQDTNLALVKAIHAWASGKPSLSYQAIANKIDSGNLFGINGDEDNPKRP